jgi:hypothetical protein
MKHVSDKLKSIAKQFPWLASECSRQMPCETGQPFKFDIYQKVIDQGCEVTVYNRWHGRDTNFYDVTKSNKTWTLEETEIQCLKI